MAKSQQQLYFYTAEGLAFVKYSSSGGAALLRAAGRVMAQRDDHQVALYGTDILGSIAHYLEGGELCSLQYTLYGYDSGKLCASVLRFNSQRKDRSIEGYHLGNGHRTYSPTCMRFNSSDTLSPHDEGGLNAYSYCGGDPINRSDPSGRLWIDFSFFKALSFLRIRRSKIPVLAKFRPMRYSPSLEQKIVNASMENRLKQHNQWVAATKTEAEIRGFITEQYGQKFGYTVHRLSEGLHVTDPDLDFNIATVSSHVEVYRRRALENPSQLNIEMATKFAEADKYLQSLQKQIRS